MAVTKTEHTKRLEPSKRQFHQWFYREVDSIPKIKEKMDKLSEALSGISDYNFQATESQWKNRQRQWNKVWRIKKNQRGPHLPVPADIIYLPLWRTKDGDVGDWRGAAPDGNDVPLIPSLLGAHNNNENSRRMYQARAQWSDMGCTTVKCGSFQAQSVSSATTESSCDPLDERYCTSGIPTNGNLETAHWPESALDPFAITYPPHLPYEAHSRNSIYSTHGYRSPILCRTANAESSDRVDPLNLSYTSNESLTQTHRGLQPPHLSSQDPIYCAPVTLPSNAGRGAFRSADKKGYVSGCSDGAKIPQHSLQELTYPFVERMAPFPQVQTQAPDDYASPTRDCSDPYRYQEISTRHDQS